MFISQLPIFDVYYIIITENYEYFIDTDAT